MKKIIQLMKKEEKLIIGLMSGTSVDGIDVALIKVNGNGLHTTYSLIYFLTFPYPDNVRKEIFEIFQPESSSVDRICSMNFTLGHLFSSAVEQLLKEANISKDEIDLIGSHGQTFYHIPENNGKLVKSTLQLGEASVLCERIGCPVVSDFRVRDMAAGGEGAPLVPYIDYLLYRSSSKNRALQNIGGIGNVTYLAKNAKIEDVIAFDTGPGNMMIDAAVEILTNGQLTYDDGGKIAMKGKVIENSLKSLMEHEYFTLPIPKSTGRERFGINFTKLIVSDLVSQNHKPEDIIATVTKFTAMSIYDQYKKFILKHHPIDEIIISGGGAKNDTLLSYLQELFPSTILLTQDQLGHSNDAKEAIAFALLANETIHGNDNNVPSATGAKSNVVLGKIAF